MHPDRIVKSASFLIAPHIVLVILAGLAVVAALAFMTVGVKANWGYVLELRGRKLAAICLVATSAAVSTILFQTVTNNRILTPSIIGFDALYALLQTVFVFFLGAARVSTADPRLMFVIEAAAMLVFSLLLYRWLFLGERRGLHLLLLVGVVFGLLFRSATQLLQRIMDPNEFVVLQDRLFASFGGVDPALIAVSGLAVAIVCAVAWRNRHRLDVLLLGRDQAINLGIDHRRAVTGILIMVSVLVSASTALVGPLNASEPISFFGVLIANLSYVLIRGYNHRYLLPASILLGFLLLTGGQLVLENLLGFDSAVGIVIEFAGGLTFILLLLKGMAR